MDYAKQIEKLKKRIAYDIKVFGDDTTYTETLEQLLEDSKYIALSLRYPFEDYSSLELPTKYYNWQLRCCDEIYSSVSRPGGMGIKSYSENGLNYTIGDDYSGYVGNSLLNEIQPKVGVIKDED